jgi:hypothetical protein
MRKLVSMTSALAWAFVTVVVVLIVYGIIVTGGGGFMSPPVRE